MSKPTEIFAVNTYSYTLEWSALDCVNHLAGLGYRGAELMLYPGHLWPADMDQAARREFKALCNDCGVKLISTNAPNIDINVAAATKEMRNYSLGILESFAVGVISSTYRDVITFVVLIIVLLIRPLGLLGARIVQKV